MHNKHGHENRYKLYKAIGHEGTKALRRFSSLAAWKHFQKSSILELKGLKVKWLNRINVRRLSWDFACADFITPFNLLTIKPFNPRALAFTMAEILISLTIIGVIAAITLPSLRANINESAWATQRKALYSRLSQAISMLPSMNGYGEYSGTWDNNVVTVTKDTAAQAFVTEGLAKVLKITNICDSNNLEKCGLPAKYTNFDGSKVDFPKNIEEYNKYFVHTSSTATFDYSAYANPLKNINTAAAAFETANGEHVAVFYNPMCANRDNKYQIANGAPGTSPYWVDAESIFPYMCATFLFDLNGKKGPNKMGKDMWFITSLYSVEPSVVMLEPNKLTKLSTNMMSFDDAKQWCAGQDARMANVDEGIAAKLSGQLGFGWFGTYTGNDNYAYLVTTNGTLIKYLKTYPDSHVRCIKR